MNGHDDPRTPEDFTESVTNAEFFGEEAARLGMSRSDNPYLFGTREYKAWDACFCSFEAFGRGGREKNDR